MKKKVKNNRKSGQSGIITAVILILLVLVSIVIIWNVVIPMVQKSSKDISASPFTDTVSIDSVKLYPNGDFYVKVSRSSGTQNIDSMQLLFYDSKGGNYKIVVNNPLKTGETITYNIKASEVKANDKISRVSVVPIISNKPGIEAKDSSAIVKKDSSGNYIPEVPANPGSIGLVSWWKFDSDAKDSVGGNDGLLKNHAKIENNSLAVDGIDDYANISDNNSLDMSNSFSISLWLNHAGNTGYYETLIDKRGPTTNYELFLNTGNKKLGFYNGGTSYLHPTDFVPSLNTWYHIVSITNSTTTDIYINGIFNQSLNSGYGPTNNAPLFIGNYPGGPAESPEPFNGSIKNVMIFNKPLNSDEVKALYNNQK